MFSEFDIDKVNEIRTFNDYHHYYTLPNHGFDTIEDFYHASSSINFLDHIDRPNLIVNALNDPILGEKCFPYAIATKSDLVFLETPPYGSHLGFTLSGKDYSWMELRTEKFINDHLI